MSRLETATKIYPTPLWEVFDYLPWDALLSYQFTNNLLMVRENRSGQEDREHLQMRSPEGCLSF